MIPIIPWLRLTWLFTNVVIISLCATLKDLNIQHYLWFTPKAIKGIKRQRDPEVKSFWPSPGTILTSSPAKFFQSECSKMRAVARSSPESRAISHMPYQKKSCLIKPPNTSLLNQVIPTGRWIFYCQCSTKKQWLAIELRRYACCRITPCLPPLKH